MKVLRQNLYVVGTGVEMHDELYYAAHIGTCIMRNGLVWHVFKGPTK
ncbi:DUF7352 domain-containing protein [Mycobacteroides salmoniphilum]